MARRSSQAKASRSLFTFDGKRLLARAREFIHEAPGVHAWRPCDGPDLNVSICHARAELLSGDNGAEGVAIRTCSLYPLPFCNAKCLFCDWYRIFRCRARKGNTRMDRRRHFAANFFSGPDDDMVYPNLSTGRLGPFQVNAETAR